MSILQLEWTEKQVFAFLKTEFPQIFTGPGKYEVVKLAPDDLEMNLLAGDSHLRPGGSISGPAQLELADFAVYFLMLAHHGAQARLSVTTNLTCSFLRKPQPGKLSCKVRMLKHGRTLSVAEAKLFDSSQKQVANMELSYFTGHIRKATPQNDA